VDTPVMPAPCPGEHREKDLVVGVVLKDVASAVPASPDVKEPTRRSVSRRSRHLLSLHIDGAPRAAYAAHVALAPLFRLGAGHQTGPLGVPDAPSNPYPCRQSAESPSRR